MADNPLNIVRDSGWQCVRKHLRNALLIYNEVLNGYSGPHNIHTELMLAHLDQAAEECLKLNPTLSQQIRQLRLEIDGQ